ncbi:MAG TPA: chorismate mutase [Clostridiales bacterium]|nr:chorismate mutase [Clostridiales bacterium]
MKTDLEIYREEIDIIDKIIAESFEKRMEIVLKVADYKKQNNLNTFDPAREQKMIEKNQNYIKDDNLKKYYVELLKKQLEVSKQYQEELKNKQ